MPGQQQQFHHVEDEQGAHAIIGEALPHLGREQESQPARMTEEVARSFAAPTPLLSPRESHNASLRCVSRCRFARSSQSLQYCTAGRGAGPQNAPPAGPKRPKQPALDACPHMRKTLRREMRPEEFAMIKFQGGLAKDALCV